MVYLSSFRAKEGKRDGGNFMNTKIEFLKEYIRDIPDFPKPGIIFKDITPLLRNPKAFRYAIELFVDRYQNQEIECVVAIESRGFIFGGALSLELGVGFVPVRKAGKLPYKTAKVSYELEYGIDSLEMHIDAIKEGENVLIFDDLLATGGTAKATAQLCKQHGANIKELAFLVELSFLKARSHLLPYQVFSLIKYE
jgi:adenine phosphoribosyltransferase